MTKHRWQSPALAGIVVATILQFGFFGYRTVGWDAYLVAQLLALAFAGLPLISLEHRFRKIGFAGAVVAFALFTLMVALYSKPIVETLHRFFQ